METVWDVVRHAASRTPDEVAVTEAEREVTYRGFVDEVLAVAAGLRALGISPGDRVATALPNTINHLTVLVAIQRLGAVAAPINPRLKPAQIADIMRSSGIEAIIAPDATELIDAVQEVVGAQGNVVIDGRAPAGCIALQECRGEADTLPQAPVPQPEDTSFLFYTAGTTGAPKAAAIPHRATQIRTLFMSTQGGLRHGDRGQFLGIMPLFHVVGFYAVALASFSMNGTCHLVPAFEPETVLRTVQRQNVTCIFAAPTMLHAMTQAASFEPQALDSVRTVLYAGSPMPFALLERLYKYLPSVDFVNIYGTTETMNTLYMRDPINSPSSLIPGYGSAVRVARIGASQEDALVGEEGELLVDATCDAVFTEYVNSTTATREKLRDGWYHTGDVGVWDAQGRIELRGRLDDMIISGGENIHPAEVEDTLARHPSIREVGVVGLPDDRWGEVVAAFVVVGENATAEELDSYVRGSPLADYKRPRRYIISDNPLPRNAANKLLRDELRQRAPRPE